MILFLFRYLLGDVGLFGIVLVFTDFVLHWVLFCFVFPLRFALLYHASL